LQGKPYVLPSVRAAEKKIMDSALNHEYAGIDGVAEFLKVSLSFCYGSKDKGSECSALKEGRVKGIQTISGTGALRVAGEFLNRFHGKGTAFYLVS
jgi:aspartate aminotransferase, mitochondrial